VLLHELRVWSGADQADDITIVIFRRRVEQLDVELRRIRDDGRGPARSAQLWIEVALPDRAAPVAAWDEALPVIVRATQSLFGRGLARELNGQLRVALEE